MFVDRGWAELLKPYTKINIDLLKEFYCNVVPDSSPMTMADSFSFTTYVRGKTIRFDRDAINDFLGNPLDLPESPDPTLGNPLDILLPGRKYIKNAAGKRKHALYQDMNAKASVVFKFLVHNVWPKSHTSDAPMEVVPLIWCIMKGTQVDVARIISNKMKSVALNCATGSKASLTFPGLVMGLLKAIGVDIPEPSDEDIEHPIDDTFIWSLIKRGQREAQYHVFDDDEAAIGVGIFNFSTLQSFMSEQRLHNQFVRDQNAYIMDQNEAIYKSNQGIHQSVYNAHVYPGNAEYPIMTPEMYQTFVHWPEGRPGPYVGVADEETESDVAFGEEDLNKGDAGDNQ